MAIVFPQGEIDKRINLPAVAVHHPGVVARSHMGCDRLAEQAGRAKNKAYHPGYEIEG